MAEKDSLMDADSIKVISNAPADVNVVLSSSSKPVRLGSFKSHVHNAGKECSVFNSMDQQKQLSTTAVPVPSQKEQQQSISMPSAVPVTGIESSVASNINNSISAGPNSGSGCATVGQSYISSNVTPPNSAGLRQTTPVATQAVQRLRNIYVID